MKNVRLGLLKTTLVDYPGEVAATVFTVGCNLRCPYCHNPEFVEGPGPEDLLWVDEILRFLDRRRNVLGGVCITGGEPLIHSWTPELAERIHDLGMKVKLDTNGLLPDRIAAVKADYISMDIKASPAEYGRVRPTDTDIGVETKLRSSIAIIRKTAPLYEFRTTVLSGIVDQPDIRAIASLLEPGDRYVLSAFRPGRTLDPALSGATPPSTSELENLAAVAREHGIDVSIREHRV